MRHPVNAQVRTGQTEPGGTSRPQVSGSSPLVGSSFPPEFRVFATRRRVASGRVSERMRDESAPAGGCECSHQQHQGGDRAAGKCRHLRRRVAGGVRPQRVVPRSVGGARIAGLHEASEAAALRASGSGLSRAGNRIKKHRGL